MPRFGTKRARNYRIPFLFLEQAAVSMATISRFVRDRFRFVDVMGPFACGVGGHRFACVAFVFVAADDIVRRSQGRSIAGSRAEGWRIAAVSAATIAGRRP